MICWGSLPAGWQRRGRATTEQTHGESEMAAANIFPFLTSCLNHRPLSSHQPLLHLTLPLSQTHPLILASPYSSPPRTNTIRTYTTTMIAISEPRAKFTSLPKCAFLFPQPSPVHKLERLSKNLGGATIWAKREDCNSPLAGGGNKVRK